MPVDPAPARADLSVLDLVPIAAGSTAGEALHRSIDLARAAEAAGYARYWLAEHHLNPGVAGSAPHVFLGILAAATERIRVGTAATIVGNSRPLQIAEAAGTVAALFPGRVDLGFGRSGLPPAKDASAPASPAPAATEPLAEAPNAVIDGLVVPPARPFRFDRARFAAQARLLGRVPGDAARFAEDVDAVRAFLAGPVPVPLADGREDEGVIDGVLVDAQPATGADVQLWVHGSSAGESARLAGRLGLRFGTNYHVAPSGVLDAVAEYRRSFRPSAELERPHVIVSVDVVVAETDAEAERLASGYAEWVLSIREGAGAVPYPTPEHARPLADFTPAELAAVRDRLDTRFVGSPATVVAALETLQRVTGADELLVTTIVHDHERRVASYRLLAEAWRSDAATGAGAASSSGTNGASTTGAVATGLDRAAFARDWERWHRAHEAARSAEHGFLAVTGLHWLDSEPTRFPGTPGSWSTGPDGPVVELGPGEVLELDGVLLGGRHAFGPVPERGGLTLRSGAIAVELARRGGRDLVRPRDPAFPFRSSYLGTPSYLPNPRWVAAGRFVPFDEPERVTVDAAVEGLQHVYEAPGRVEFELRGEPFALTVFNGAAPGSLFALFTDATSGLTTYAANRSLAIDAPDEDGAVRLDFNRAVNLPCAYTDFATCPLPPAGNRLPIGIEAGEKTPLARQGA